MFECPAISGDTIDYKSNKVLVGSHLDKNPVQIFDYNKRELLEMVPHFEKNEVR